MDRKKSKLKKIVDFFLLMPSQTPATTPPDIFPIDTISILKIKSSIPEIKLQKGIQYDQLKLK